MVFFHFTDFEGRNLIIRNIICNSTPFLNTFPCESVSHTGQIWNFSLQFYTNSRVFSMFGCITLCGSAGCLHSCSQHESWPSVLLWMRHHSLLLTSLLTFLFSICCPDPEALSSATLSLAANEASSQVSFSFIVKLKNTILFTHIKRCKQGEMFN